MFLEKNKRSCPFIREVWVLCTYVLLAHCFNRGVIILDHFSYYLCANIKQVVIWVELIISRGFSQCTNQTYLKNWQWLQGHFSTVVFFFKILFDQKLFMLFQGWIHYMTHDPEPHILLFKRSLALYGQNAANQASNQVTAN